MFQDIAFINLYVCERETDNKEEETAVIENEASDKIEEDVRAV